MSDRCTCRYEGQVTGHRVTDPRCPRHREEIRLLEALRLEREKSARLEGALQAVSDEAARCESRGAPLPVAASVLKQVRAALAATKPEKDGGDFDPTAKRSKDAVP